MDRSYLDADVLRNSRTSSNSATTSPSKLKNQRQNKEYNASKQLSKAQFRDLCTPVFPAQQPNTIVECMKLKTWNTISPRDQILDPLQHEQIHLRAPFPINDKINRKLALWVGDITNLDCQAIVHTTNENFKEDMPTTRRIYAKAGYEMYNYLKTNIGTCRTGDIQVTNGFGLNCRYCFHTVGPKYKEKFHTAAENALFNCYFKVLNAMREYKVSTLALCPINTVRRGYPLQSAVHIGLRTLRRFLEKHLDDDIDRIVFVVDELEVGIYEQILPLYFPKNENEEICSCYKLPHDLGGENGEPLLPERAIRVVDRPTLVSKQPSIRIKYNRNQSEINSKEYNRRFKADLAEEAFEDNDFDGSIDLTSGLESSVIVGKTSFAKMKNDVDKKWLMQNGMHGNQPNRNPNNRFLPSNSTENAYKYELNRKILYNSLLRQARSSDHSDIMQLRWLYINGVDRLGRSVIVIIGSHFHSNISLEKALLYFIYLMDRIKDREYTLVYFHSNVNENNYIPINFLRYVYDTLDPVYIRNLNAVYVVHPSIWFKLATWWFVTFSITGLKNKVISVKSLLDLDTVLELQHLKIPQSILDVDFKTNGNRYVAQDASEAFY